MNASNDSVHSDVADRRQRFRIDDTAILEVSPIEVDAAEKSPADDFFSPSAPFKLVRELQAIEGDHHGLMRAIAEQNSELAAYLGAMNKKIEAIGSAVAEATLGEDQKLQSIDLSEGGIGFTHDAELSRDGYYAIKIWFHRALIGFAAYIKVVASSRAIDGGYHISASFHALPEAESQIIAKHIMQVQAEAQRAKRQLSEDSQD
ncbi:MAG: hypothetical protein KJP25_06375 [Gammaproteobacteria bacterium]|nr:hypothetical protein [Gammaproteobacteria bacterium]MBT8151568.1 hypothetical protein [Gammaproteobacteria bacterium]NND38360.1 hypothetical protein [Pseudomonadales bacterium]NNM12350.1 hypothetical protein [Pseudomonadales bacterium]RZV57919.1 MAG: hypothetical protein EX270_03270 [Pseudomonadales bacterium]